MKRQSAWGHNEGKEEVPSHLGAPEDSVLGVGSYLEMGLLLLKPQC